MSDLERADRELAALGAVPASLAELVKRYGEADRSIARADEVLASLDNGVSPSTPAEPLPPRPSFLPLGWAEQQQTANGTEQSPIAAQPNDEITVTSGLPEALPDEAPRSEPPPQLEAAGLDAAAESIVAQAAEAEASLSEPPAPLSAVDELREPEPDEDAAEAPGDEEDEPRISMPLPESLAPVSAAIDPASMRPGSVVSRETYAPRSSRPPRPDIARLLDEELDPREFPSSRPPPPGMPVPTPVPALPPVPRVSQAPSEPAEAESDFELLVDDDDIIEIDEEEN